MNLRSFMVLAATLLAGLCTAAEPASGRVIDLPVMLWSDDIGSTAGKAQCTIPSNLDTEGTVTLTVRSSSDFNVAILQRDAVPADLQFLFDQSSSMYIRLDEKETADWFGGEFIELLGSIPFNRSSKEKESRRVQFLDADGDPLQNFRLDVQVSGRFSAYDPPFQEVAISGNSEASLPVVADYMQWKIIPTTQANKPYVLLVTDQTTGQKFATELRLRGSVQLTQIIVPALPAAASLSKAAEAVILAGDGTPQSRTTITVVQNYKAPNRAELARYDDPETIYVNQTQPSADGKIKLVIPAGLPALSPPGNVVSVSIEEHDKGFFTETTATLEIGKSRTITLPKRLTLAASLLNRDGTGVDFEENLWNPDTWSGIRVASLNEDCRLTKWDLMPLRDGDATGTAFLLHNIPVPGTYAIAYLGRRYGPVQITETSPTEVLKLPRMTEGRRRGRVLDETSQPLANALLVIVTTAADVRNVKRMADQLEKITSSSDTWKQLKSLRCNIVEYTFTNASGEFSLSRNNMVLLSERPTIMAVAPGRIAALLYEPTSECQVPYSEHVELGEVQLPRKTYATGTVLLPAVIPDDDNLGQTIPLPASPGKYFVSLRSTYMWFNQKTDGKSYWQYNNEPVYADYGQPFTCAVPIGIPFYLEAKAENYMLSNYLWYNKGLTDVSTGLNLGSVNLRPLKPIVLKVQYEDGSPADNVYVVQDGVSAKNKLDGSRHRSVTDKNGTIILYTDKGLTGPMALYNQSHRGIYQRFPSQKVDVSTSSVPTLTLKLNPQIWSRQ